MAVPGVFFQVLLVGLVVVSVSSPLKVEGRQFGQPGLGGLVVIPDRFLKGGSCHSTWASLFGIAIWWFSQVP